jgi:hypothetical protein
MALIFPSNPTINQTYQSGSSSTYLWNGSYWETSLPPTQVVVQSTSASFAISSSFAQTASITSQINDQGSSGYMDIGSVRYQWGTATNTASPTQTVTLPASFANTNYTVTSNIQSNRSDLLFSTTNTVVSTTQFTVTKMATDASVISSAAEPFSWIAIGLKP